MWKNLIFSSCLIASALAVTILPDHTFVPPFNNFNNEGMRTIPNWNSGGNGLDLNENFIRLTPDRVARKGFLWNTKAIDKDEWSVTLRFRVSGQGKRMFGDGLAVFFTNHPNYREGSLHGFTDLFKGFGIIFDTYVNTDPGHVHKDILVVSNDGTMNKAAPHGGTNDPNPSGCDDDFSEFRYWEGRDDFSVYNHSVARIVFRNNQVSVYIDSRATGTWSSCVKDVPVVAPAGWHRENNGAYLGIIATTGDLADNHDILSLQTTLEDEPAPNPFDISRTNAGENDLPITTGNKQIDDAMSAMVARSAITINDRVAYIHRKYIHKFFFRITNAHYINSQFHYILIFFFLYILFLDHMEHQLSAVNDGIKAALKKLTEAEESNKRRIEELEKRMSEKVSNTVEGSIADRLVRLEAQMDAKLKNDVLPQLQESVSSSSRTWFIPFLILCIILLCGFSISYRQIRWLVKQQTGLDLPFGYSPQKKK